jgi:pimeloyl-ACP methyl ester carboxylesterase
MIDWKLDEEYDTAGGVVRWSRFGSGPPVVLLHGTPFSSVVWRGVVRALASGHEVFVWDMLGYGSSEKLAGGDVSLAAQGRVFAGLLEHWGLTEPSVIAHDFGGAVALRAHLLHGARYRRLALSNAVALGPWGSPFFRLVRDNAAVFEQLPSNLHRALVREYVSAASHTGLLPALLDRLTEPWLGEEGQAAFYRQIAQADQRHTTEIADRYGEIDLPVLVCWGANDTWIPASRGRELAARIPGASFRLLADAGHLVQEDAPEELVATLIAFLGN